MAEPDTASWENLPVDKLTLSERPERLEVPDTADAVKPEASGEAKTAYTAPDEPPVSSPAPVVKAAEPPASPPKVDPAVIDALATPEHRITVLRFEQEVAAFVENSELPEVTFMEQLPGYERLLAHRVAQYYGLETWTVIDGEHRGKITARRTASTVMPKVKLAEVPSPAGSGADTLPAPARLEPA